MFAYILELLREGGHEAFFELKKGGRKANNAQKEKRRLARKRSRASKREREREAAKAAKLPTRQRQCEACGRKFESRKTAKKHKCPNSKVVRVTSCYPHPPTPTPPPHITSLPAVTGDSQDNSPFMWIHSIGTGHERKIRKEDAQRYRETGLWAPGRSKTCG
ncbi:hypothetical protein BGW80DRAFT_1322951 [Lactifluus volemus]|nr:hypothetical protein BGW80DRAFT_1424924 [Lactifluus volemus]KAH9971248.1 hypothetical protein BGW80DRAFT_1322951 [Lactifluus volemus]